MAAWGVVVVCGIGGAAAGPLLDVVARRVPSRAAPPVAPAPAAPAPAALEPDAPPILPPATPAPAALEPDATPIPPPAARAREVAGVCAVAALAGALLAVRVGPHPALAAYGVLFAALVALSDADLRTGLVPRRILYPSAVLVAAGLAAASAASGEWHRLGDAAIGAAALFAVFGAVWWLWPKGMGFGDVRLIALCGGALGWLGFAPLYLGILSGCVAGVVMGLVALARTGRRRFPFAPALALGTAFGVLWGTWLGNLWLHPR